MLYAYVRTLNSDFNENYYKHCNNKYWPRMNEDTRWFKYDRDDLCVNKSQFVPVIFEPPCIKQILNSHNLIFFYVPLQAWTGPWGSSRLSPGFSWRSAHGGRSSALRTDRLYSQKFSWYSFLEAESCHNSVPYLSSSRLPLKMQKFTNITKDYKCSLWFYLGVKLRRSHSNWFRVFEKRRWRSYLSVNGRKTRETRTHCTMRRSFWSVKLAK
jgi:hypothetical protein